MIGRVIDGRYRIEKLLGQGGMGAVFIAEHVRLQKKVALKVIAAEHAGNEELAERFAREAMVTAKLTHPHVASAIDFNVMPGGGAYLVMELAPGRPLGKIIATRPGPELACEVGAQIADALAAAHALGIAHRDLKPGNVLVAERDANLHATVLDFGLAGVGASTASERLTRIGTVLGTPGYMAPEQAVGDSPDARADIYALGVLLWEATTGRRLFVFDDFAGFLAAQTGTTPPLLRQLAPSAPRELEELVARMLVKDRSQRFPWVTAARDVLRGIAPPPPRLSMPDARPEARVSFLSIADIQAHAQAAAAPQRAIATVAARPALKMAQPHEATLRRSGETQARRQRSRAPLVLAVSFGVGASIATGAFALYLGTSEPAGPVVAVSPQPAPSVAAAAPAPTATSRSEQAAIPSGVSPDSVEIAAPAPAPRAHRVRSAIARERGDAHEEAQDLPVSTGPAAFPDRPPAPAATTPVLVPAAPPSGAPSPDPAPSSDDATGKDQ